MLFPYRHLHEVHKPNDKNAAQVRIQMQLVNQLEVQVSLTDTVVLINTSSSSSTVLVLYYYYYCLL